MKTLKDVEEGVFFTRLGNYKRQPLPTHKKIYRSIQGAVSNFFYWLRTHTVDRYHIVDCRSPQNDYKWGWCDRDHLMLCACFNILRDFVERELEGGDGGLTDWNGSEHNRAAKAEIDALYAWWKSGRAQEHKDLYSRKFNYDEMTALDARDDEMLARLLAVRGYLWT